MPQPAWGKPQLVWLFYTLNLLPGAQVGVMTSIFPIAYGFSKFASGVLGARTSPTLLLGGGLMATALVNITFGFGASMTWWVALPILWCRPAEMQQCRLRGTAVHCLRVLWIRQAADGCMGCSLECSLR